MDISEVALACLEAPCRVPEEVPVHGQRMKVGKFVVLLAFHVGDT